MSDLTPAAMAWLSSHHDVITTERLRACGVGRSTTERLCRGGVLRRPHKGVYVLASAKPTLEMRCAVLCAAHPTGFVTGPTAGAMLPLRRMPRSASIHFAVRHGLHLPTEQGVVFHQTTAMRAHHVDRRPDGLRVAKPARLAFDLATALAPLDHLSVLHQLIDERWVTLEELMAIGDELCHPARRGSGRFRESLERLGSGPACDSHPEVALCDALQRRDVPVERQTLTVRARGGRTAHIDLAVPEIRWGIELDIHPEHRSLEGHAGDARRYRELHLVDWQIEPVSESDVADLEALADELTTLYRSRRAQFKARPSAT